MAVPKPWCAGAPKARPPPCRRSSPPANSRPCSPWAVLGRTPLGESADSSLSRVMPRHHKLFTAKQQEYINTRLSITPKIVALPLQAACLCCGYPADGPCKRHTVSAQSKAVAFAAHPLDARPAKVIPRRPREQNQNHRLQQVPLGRFMCLVCLPSGTLEQGPRIIWSRSPEGGGNVLGALHGPLTAGLMLEVGTARNIGRLSLGFG